MKNWILMASFILIGSLGIQANTTLSGGETTSFDHSPWTKLLQKNVTAKGNVNYKGFKNDIVALDKYLNDLSNTTIDVKLWSVNERKAFWINAYNAFTVKLILNNYPVKAINDIKTPWKQKFISIGGKKLSLNQIEHEILRPKFKDPRVHFAIVCASKDCPLLLNVAFEAKTLEKQLETQTAVFVNDPQRNKVSVKKLQISEIFNWFKTDFTANGTVADFVNKYSKVKAGPKAKISYLTYNWNLNE